MAFNPAYQEELSAPPGGMPMQPQIPSSPVDQYSRAIAGGIETPGGTHINPATGQPWVGSKGETGASQIMESTGRDPGYGVKPLQDTSEEENRRFGRDYYQAMYQKFGDPVLAAAAYNAGPGRLQSALKRAEQSGQDYQQFLPASTRDYIAKFSNLVSQGKAPAFQAQPIDLNPVKVAQHQTRQETENLTHDQDNPEELQRIIFSSDTAPSVRSAAIDRLNNVTMANSQASQIEQVGNALFNAKTPQERKQAASDFERFRAEHDGPQWGKAFLAWISGDRAAMSRSLLGDSVVYRAELDANGKMHTVAYSQYGTPLTAFNAQGARIDDLGSLGVSSLPTGRGGMAGMAALAKPTNVPGTAMVDPMDPSKTYTTMVINGQVRQVGPNGRPPAPEVEARLIPKDVWAAQQKGNISVDTAIQKAQGTAGIRVQTATSEAEGKEFVNKFIPAIQEDSVAAKKLNTRLPQNIDIILNNPKIIGTLNAKAGVISSTIRNALDEGITAGITLKAPAITELRKLDWKDEDIENFNILAQNSQAIAGATIKQNLGEARNITDYERRQNTAANGDINKSSSGALLNTYATTLFNADMAAEKARLLDKYRLEGGTSRAAFESQWNEKYSVYLKGFMAWQNKIASYVAKDASDRGIVSAYKAVPIPRIDDQGNLSGVPQEGTKRKPLSQF